MRPQNNNYFVYKRSKMRQMTVEKPKKEISKFNFLLQLFIATFIIIFIFIVVFIMKYSSKIDIEYAKGDISYQKNEDGSDTTVSYANTDEEQKQIDKRLALIQQEENAPYEAKVLYKNQNTDVMDVNIVEQNKKIEKQEKKKQKEQEMNNLQEQDTKKNTLILDRIKNTVKDDDTETVQNKNQIIMYKVLIGRFISLEEAQSMQGEIKTRDSSLTPFVKKFGEAFSVQVGSYKDFEIAKAQAQKLKVKGYDVWIYKQ